MRVFIRLLIAFIVAFCLDGASKIWAEQALVQHEPVPILGEIFRFTLGYNTGVAFGMFANGGMWPLLITGIVIIGLVIWSIMTLRQGPIPPLIGVAIGLLLGGAIGNFVDRLPDGQVTDFLDVGIGASRWPTFNLADSFILIGLALMLLLEATTKPKDPVQSDTQSPKMNDNIALMDD